LSVKDKHVKVYDKVSLDFLKAILTVMNFDTKWIKWFMECASLVQYTLLINGNLTNSFKPFQGLRQGDPLSTYVFLMCANILSFSLSQAKNLKKIKEIKIGRNGLSFSHLLFVDDSLLIFRKDNCKVVISN